MTESSTPSTLPTGPIDPSNALSVIGAAIFTALLTEGNKN